MNKDTHIAKNRVACSDLNARDEFHSISNWFIKITFTYGHKPYLRSWRWMDSRRAGQLSLCRWTWGHLDTTWGRPRRPRTHNTNHTAPDQGRNHWARDTGSWQLTLQNTTGTGLKYHYSIAMKVHLSRPFVQTQKTQKSTLYIGDSHG